MLKAGALRSAASGDGAQIAFRDLFFLTAGNDHLTQRIRGAQIDGLVRHLPLTSAVNLLNALLLAFTLHGQVPSLDLGL